jgi:ABC-type sugar transport system ATPase subunit
VIAGFRPEHLAWAGDDPRAAIVGEAVVVEPLGSDTLVSLDLAGAGVIARLPPRLVRRAGERVALTVDPAHVHVFDRSTGRRL